MIDEKVFDSLSFPDSPAGLYDPLRYMISIGGKRIRPRLCLTTYKLFGGNDANDIMEPAAALEVFHTFTLIHDDIMDRSPLRRGVPTVWKKWNEDTAILSGDVMLIDAYARIAKAPAHCRAEVMDLFTTTAREVCEGQQLDMEMENDDYPSMDGYTRMIGLKTAVLLACSAKMGALLAGASADACEALYRYGYELGIAFQIADDYLDAYGDEKVFGKPIGGDILNAKKSWLNVRALEKTPDKPGFISALNAEAADADDAKRKILSIKNIYDELDVPAEARAEILRYTARAMDAVSGVSCDTGVLKEFADKLIGRAK